MDRLIVVSKAIERKIHEEGVSGAGQPDLQRRGSAALQPPAAVLHAPRRLLDPEASPIVGVVARLEAEKGHRTLIDCWPLVLAAHPEAWLLVVGEGSERNSLEGQAAALGISERVVFTAARGRTGGHRGPGRGRFCRRTAKPRA